MIVHGFAAQSIVPPVPYSGPVFQLPVGFTTIFPTAILPPLWGALAWFYLKVAMALLALRWIFEMVAEAGRPFPAWAQGLVAVTGRSDWAQGLIAAGAGKGVVGTMSRSACPSSPAWPPA